MYIHIHIQFYIHTTYLYFHCGAWWCSVSIHRRERVILLVGFSNFISLDEITTETLMMQQYFKTNEDFTRARRLWSLIRTKSAWALIRTTICAIWIYMYRSVERMLVQIMITNTPAHDIIINERVYIRNCPNVPCDGANYHPVRFIASFTLCFLIVIRAQYYVAWEISRF